MSFTVIQSLDIDYEYSMNDNHVRIEDALEYNTIVDLVLRDKNNEYTIFYTNFYDCIC